ncbi:hypothetical protein PTKIN_Ptkin09bG0113600 [Pterospermum kingtungense]
MGEGRQRPTMGLLRSEAMQLVQLIIPVESSYRTISCLGDLGLFSIQRPQFGEEPVPTNIRFTESGEIARKLCFFKEQMMKAGLSPSARSTRSDNVDLDNLEVKLGEFEAELMEMNANHQKLEQSYSELIEYKLVLPRMIYLTGIVFLFQAGKFFQSAQSIPAAKQGEAEGQQRGEGSIGSPLLVEQEMVTDPSKQVKLVFGSGLVPREKSLTFERIMFRATRGNVFLKQSVVEDTDPSSGEKLVPTFTIVDLKFLGVTFICGSSICTYFFLNSILAQKVCWFDLYFLLMSISLEVILFILLVMHAVPSLLCSEIKDLYHFYLLLQFEKNVFVVFYFGDRARNKIMKICEAFGANKYPFTEDLGKQLQIIMEVSGRLEELKTTIYVGLVHQSNLLQIIAYHFEDWSLLVKKEKSIYHTLNMLSIDVTKKCLVAEGWCPVFATNKAATDSNSQLGTIFHVLRKESPPTYFHTNKFTASYKEIVDAYGIAKYREANPGVFTIITFPFLFAAMFGDWGHGICLFLATSYFIIREKKFSGQKLGDITEMTFGGRYVIMMALFSIYTGLIYNEFFSVPFELFGPSAYRCHNPSCSDASTAGLVKVRVTYPFGVDPKWHGTRSELPFLNSLKMKMSILLGVAQMNLGIILSYFNAKFFKNELNIWYHFVPQMIFLNSLFGYLSLLIVVKWCTGSQADLYHLMIYMFLSSTDDPGDKQLFWGQKFFQRHRGQSYAPLHNLDGPVEMESHHGSDSHEEFEFSEIFIHQLIHTIEFVLGAVSNTASYLRLWALSLAHSELSSVFYDEVLLLAWRFNNTIILIIGIFVFKCATIRVLLVMETLSAFLHALRLHWVEFHNKFYEGDGYKFQPFSFTVLSKEEDE